jgi:GNAT superfamily N-acetyltransferase
LRFSDRPFVASDAPYVVATHLLEHAKGFVSAPPTEQQVIESLQAPNVRRRIVLDEHSERAGLWMAKDHEGWLVEIGLIVAQVPRKGIGRFALRSALQWAFGEIGAHRVWLEVVASNVPARTLYESEGFLLEGTYRDGFRRPDKTYEDLMHYGLLRSEWNP